ncbi:FadR/GntR family transcriptional regulator [Parasulfitobacter algicola]|uniref:FadR family transcriptional regulator n=1 Tax=Parasulfitobacter algicola TaxID=2614809 RepID=A0ABX2IL17_9RHOB|nr:FCD domain-containing protein [Sulfitobacter algicola]NSX53547.1 FadR family transcriptional regulator [Sulfitobacter algicola]
MSQARLVQLATTKQLMGDVPRRSVRDLIAEKLATLISSGVIAQGDELPGERELATSLSVSRETMRGAIGILAAHGILKVSHGARTVVANCDVSALVPQGPITPLGGRYDLASVHEARLTVEQRIAISAAVQITDDQLSGLEASIAAQEACGEDAVRFLLSDREFHALLYRAGGNDVLFDMAMALYNHQLDHRRRIVARPGSIVQSVADHRAILSALASGNAEDAAAAVVGHATRIFETTRQFLEDEGGQSR